MTIKRRIYAAAFSLMCGIHSGFPLCCSFWNALFLLMLPKKWVHGFWQAHYALQYKINRFTGYGLSCPFHIWTRKTPITMNICSCDHIAVMSQNGIIVSEFTWIHSHMSLPLDQNSIIRTKTLLATQRVSIKDIEAVLETRKQMEQ